MSVDEKIKQDVEKLMYDILTNNIDDVSPIELEDIKGMLPLLKEIYPEEIKQAYIKSQNSQKRRSLIN